MSQMVEVTLTLPSKLVSLSVFLEVCVVWTLVRFYFIFGVMHLLFVCILSNYYCKPCWINLGFFSITTGDQTLLPSIYAHHIGWLVRKTESLQLLTRYCIHWKVIPRDLNVYNALYMCTTTLHNKAKQNNDDSFSLFLFWFHWN